MLNLLRMELRTMFRSKGIYITFTALLGVLLIALGTMKLVTTPSMKQEAAKHGMEFDADDESDAQEFLADTQTDFVSNLLFNGGLMTVLMAIIGCIAVCEDFDNGFVKNIFSCCTDRKAYVFSKLILLAVVSAAFLVLLSLCTFVLFRVFGFTNPIGDLPRLLLMFVIGWLGLISLSAQSIFFCMLTRNTILSILLSIACGLGAFDGMLDLLTGQAGIHIAEFFPSYNVLMAPYISGGSDTANNSLLALMLGGSMTASAPALSVLVSLAWTAIYTFLAAAILKRKDIC